MVVSWESQAKKWGQGRVRNPCLKPQRWQGRFGQQKVTSLGEQWFSILAAHGLIDHTDALGPTPQISGGTYGLNHSILKKISPGDGKMLPGLRTIGVLPRVHLG